MKISMQAKPVKIKTLSLSPATHSPLTHHPMRGKSLLQRQPKKKSKHPPSAFGSATILPDAGNQPEPSQSDIERLQGNKKFINTIVEDSLKDHPQDVLHGSRSLSMLIPNFSRTPKDWDLFSPQEQKRALQLEAEIDKQAGCDIAQTQYRHVPKMPFTPEMPGTGEHLYRVITPKIKGDPEIDVMDRPKELDTVRKHNITHESLIEAHHKATTRRLRQPLMAQKALSDMKDIEAYWKKRGRPTKK